MFPVFINVNDVVEYYVTFFDSEDYDSLPSEDWFDCRNHDSTCVESTIDKSDVMDSSFICFDSSENYCF
jgi:hypothetical protein